MPSRSRSLLVAKGDRSERQGVGVIVDTNGHLGTVVSSKRFKDDIKPMDKASEAISYPDFRFGSLLRLFELGDRFRQKFGVPIEPRKSEGTVAGKNPECSHLVDGLGCTKGSSMRTFRVLESYY